MPFKRFKQWKTSARDVTLTVNRSEDSDGDEPRLEFTTILVQANDENPGYSISSRTMESILDDTGLTARQSITHRRLFNSIHPYSGGTVFIGTAIRAWDSDRSLESDRESNRNSMNEAIQNAVTNHLSMATFNEISETALNQINLSEVVSRSEIETSFRNDDDIVGIQGVFFNHPHTDTTERGDGGAFHNSFTFNIGGTSPDNPNYTVTGTTIISRADVVINVRE